MLRVFTCSTKEKEEESVVKKISEKATPIKEPMDLRSTLTLVARHHHQQRL
jgi:hypothetical protein